MMIDVSFFLLGLNVNSTLVDDGGAGLPPGAIAYADFKNGTYYYGGNALSDFLTSDFNWGSFDLTTVCPSVGVYRPTNSGNTSPVIASTLASQMISGGFTMVVTFLMASEGEWNIDVFDSPNFTADVFWNYNTNGLSHTGLTADSEVVYPVTLTAGMHVAAMTYNAGHLAMCLDGANVISQDMAVAPSVVNSIGITSSYVWSKLVVYPAKADGAIAALCAFDPSTTPTNSVAPAITGTAQAGQTLTCSTGIWLNAVSIHIHWSNANTGVFVGSGSDYTAQASDVGAQLVADVFAENASGTAHSAVTSATVIAA